MSICASWLVSLWVQRQTYQCATQYLNFMDLAIPFCGARGRMFLGGIQECLVGCERGV